VADQLQTNYAGDLRNVLKAVFEINCPPPQIDDDNDSNPDGCDSPTAGSGDNSSGDMNTEETGSESGTDTRTFGGRLLVTSLHFNNFLFSFLLLRLSLYFDYIYFIFILLLR